MTSSETPDQVIRLPLLVIFIAALAMIGLGIVGGMVGQQLLHPQLPPLENGKEQSGATIQQITVSPNNAVADLVDRTQRSILLLSRTPVTTDGTLATAFTLTNDGLLVTNTLSNTDSVQGIDDKGQTVALNKVGIDEIFGLTYYRAANSVLAPLDIEQNESAIGQTVLAITRNRTTLEPSVKAWQINSYDLPEVSSASGIQRLMRGDPLAVPNGTPLLNDNGRVVGIVVDAEKGIALPVSGLRDSFNRVANNAISKNVFTDLGLTLSYSFLLPSENTPVSFIAEVKSITPGGSAATAGLQKSDRLGSINNEPVLWTKNIVTQLAAPLPLTITAQRDNAPQTITIQAK